MLFHDRVFYIEDGASFAVAIFFALSGWLIGAMLLEQTPSDVGRFYFNRAVRIWIPYFIALALLICASILYGDFSLQWIEAVVYKSSFVFNWFGEEAGVGRAVLDGTGTHFWSINVESQFYLIAPILIVLLQPSLRTSTFVWAALSILLCTFTGYGSLAVGVFAAILSKHWPGFQLRTPVRAGLVLLFVGALFAYANGVSFGLVAPLASVSIVLLLAIPGERSRIGEIAGGMSYALYLNHWIGVFVGNVLFDPMELRDSGIRKVFSAVFSLVFAVAHYLYIDRAIMKRRKAWYTLFRSQLMTAFSFALIASGFVLGISLFLVRRVPVF